jgi:2-hydroxy-3-keto-5-methylthiopentenyl-1-phosphate phosphatase
MARSLSMRTASVDLSNASVFLDFDGTMTLGDVGVHLLERVGDPSWPDLDAAYAAGAIGSRECLVAQWNLLPRDERLLRAVAAEVPVDPAARPLVEGLRTAGAEVTVVSDGWGFYIEDALAGMDLPVLTNEVDFVTGEVGFPNLDRCCPCSTCGTCKQAPIKDARRRGRTAVFVGDGTSDRKAALLADVVFAKHHLADWCDDLDVPHIRFVTLADVHRTLLG